jgi:spore coat polysaccharide biosynthesis predicted glycosyltransferase SpsG
MSPQLILRVHADARLGLGHVARALAIEEAWRALGGTALLAVSGDARARRVGSGRHPFLDEALPCPAVDLGEDLHAPLPASAQGEVVLVDQWDTTAAQLDALRPRKVALMEDDGEAHERADLLFQPFLEGVTWAEHPVKTVEGEKRRPYEDRRGPCRVVLGARFAVVGKIAQKLRPQREPDAALSVHKLLITFGGSDGAALAPRAFEVLRRLVEEGRWTGASTILAPGGLAGAKPLPGCTVLEGIPGLVGRLRDYDAVWCAAGITLCECLAMGVPVAAWGQNPRQAAILSDLSLGGTCCDLGEGPEADLAVATEAMAHWLSPEGQETRQEQIGAGMLLVDGKGASRVAQELWKLAGA